MPMSLWLPLLGPVRSPESRVPRRAERVGDISESHWAERPSPAGAKVGKDALIVGFDDEHRAARADPPLTTLHQRIEAMATYVVEVLAQAGRGDAHLDPVRDELSTQLVVRASTRS